MAVKRLAHHCMLAMLCVAMCTTTVSARDDNATPAEATAMVKEGIAYIKAHGRAKAYAEINARPGRFTDRDLYLVVYGIDGIVRAHGANPQMIGKNLLDLKDIDGKAFVQERVDLAKANNSFWQTYKFTNPVSKKIESKSAYCERLDDVVVCGGVYK
jgi:signal transduction histidine kinase